MLTVPVNRKPRRAWSKGISHGWGDPVSTVGQIDEDTRRRHCAKRVERPSGQVRSGQVGFGSSAELELPNIQPLSTSTGGSTQMKEISTERCLVFAREDPALGRRVVPMAVPTSTVASAVFRHLLPPPASPHRVSGHVRSCPQLDKGGRRSDR
jgi:hypothetical protein